MITPTYLPHLGGTERVVYNLSNWLAREGNRVTIVTPQQLQADDHAFTHERGVSIVRFPFAQKRGLTLLTQNTNCILKTIGAHDRQRFDVIHQFHVVALGAACVSLKKIMQRPLVTSLMGWDTYSPEQSRFYRASRPFATWVLNSSDVVTSPSYDVATHARQDGCCPAIQIIPHGVDSGSFNKLPERDESTVRKELGFTQGERIILTVNRLDPRKNLETLVCAAPKVLQRCPDVKFLVAGEGPQLSSLMSLAKEKRVEASFRFLGRISERSLASYYSAADLFVLTSIYEAFGVVLVEAMAAAKTVIAPRVGGIPEIVKDGETGFLFPARNTRVLTDLMLRVLEDKELRAIIGERAREMAETHFTWDRIVKRYLDAYSASLVS